LLNLPGKAEKGEPAKVRRVNNAPGIKTKNRLGSTKKGRQIKGKNWYHTTSDSQPKSEATQKVLNRLGRGEGIAS